MTAIFFDGQQVIRTDSSLHLKCNLRCAPSSQSNLIAGGELEITARSSSRAELSNMLSPH